MGRYIGRTGRVTPFNSPQIKYLWSFKTKAMANKTNHKVILGDSRQMKELGDKSVHLIVTSPPYWQLKDYGTENQIGFHDDYETYINHLNLTL